MLQRLALVLLAAASLTLPSGCCALHQCGGCGPCGGGAHCGSPGDDRGSCGHGSCGHGSAGTRAGSVGCLARNAGATAAAMKFTGASGTNDPRTARIRVIAAAISSDTAAAAVITTAATTCTAWNTPACRKARPWSRPSTTAAHGACGRRVRRTTSMVLALSSNPAWHGTPPIVGGSRQCSSLLRPQLRHKRA